MKKLSVLSGVAILALTLSSFAVKGECLKSKESHDASTALTELEQPLSNELLNQNENDLWLIENIVFIEIEEEIDLGFDTADYLPIGFDAYAGMELDLNGIDFVEFEEEIDLGFDTADYLPAGFDAYAGMELDLNEIDFVEFEEEIDLGFDTANYLPAGFDAYTDMAIEPKISLYHHGKDTKSFVVEFNSQAQGSKIRLTDENARTIYWENIQETDYIKKFNFKDLAIGTYFFSVENALSSVVYTLDVNSNDLKIANTAENIAKPVFKKLGDKVYVYLFNADQQKVDIEIFDNQSNVVFKESTKGELIVGKAFNFKKALKGSYTIRLNDGEETYYQNIKIG